MKIYEIGTGYTPIPAQISAATEIVVEELTKVFLEKNVSVEIIDIAADNRVDNALPIREVRVPGIFLRTDVQLGIMHKLKRVVYSIGLAMELKKVLEHAEEKVVLHFHNQYNLFFFLKLISKKLRKKSLIAYTNHSGIWCLEWTSIEETIKKRYFQEVECMKQADIVFLLNQDTKQNVMDHLGVSEERLIVVNNGVNTKIYHPLSDQEKTEAKKIWNLSEKIVFLQVGSVYENKGQLRSVEYLLPLLIKHPEIVFAYAGGIVDEGYHQQIEDYARAKGIADQVQYLGMLSPGKDLNMLYNTACATIIASKYEGFVLVAVESAAAGVPVLVSEGGPVCFGEGSIVYNMENFAEIVETQILNSGKEYEGLCHAARENAVNQYGWQKVAEDYLAVFENGGKHYNKQ